MFRLLPAERFMVEGDARVCEGGFGSVVMES